MLFQYLEQKLIREKMWDDRLINIGLFNGVILLCV